MKLLRTIARYLLDSGVFVASGAKFYLNNSGTPTIEGPEVLDEPVLNVTANNGSLGGVALRSRGLPASVRTLGGASGGRWTDTFANGGGWVVRVTGTTGGAPGLGAVDLSTDSAAASAFSHVLALRSAGTANLLAGYENAVERFKITANGTAMFPNLYVPAGGRLGVGTTAPSTTLHVEDTRVGGLDPHVLFRAGKAGGNAASVAFQRPSLDLQMLFSFETASAGDPDGYFGTAVGVPDVIWILSQNGGSGSIAVHPTRGLIVGRGLGFHDNPPAAIDPDGVGKMASLELVRQLKLGANNQSGFPTPAVAGAGALAYNPITKDLALSDGAAWKTVGGAPDMDKPLSNPQRTAVNEITARARRAARLQMARNFI